MIKIFEALFVKLHHLNFVGKIEKTVAKMNLSEKIFFYVLCFVFASSAIVILFNVSNLFMVEVPAFGGSFSEGLVGSPRFIKPVLAISDTDKDLVSLVYSGLLKQSGDGKLIADMAESYEIKDGGTIYDVLIRNDAYFHDGKPVTSDDIIFTIDKIADPVIKSPKRASWEGVTVEKISQKEIRFILKKPYAPFVYALTLGILPKHIWENASSEEFPFSQCNIDPVGSGPYKANKITRNSGGIPTDITLIAWDKYPPGKPKIESMTLKFFQNEAALAKALKDKSVESAYGLSWSSGKEILEAGENIFKKTSLPRVFGVFFNQNIAPVFLNKEIREALDMSAPKKRIVEEAMGGFGKVINGPTPENTETDYTKSIGNIEAAKDLLLKNGWKQNENGLMQKKTKGGTVDFVFSISTSDTPELKKTAEILKETWEKLGAKIDIKIFESGDLSQNVIKPRKYDALLFGEIIGSDSDLYPFWHSSERNDPGLNVSLYANITVDKTLEEIQTETDLDELKNKKETVLAEIKNDKPAVFLFSPDFIYIPAADIKNMVMKDISYPSDRFVSINQWFIETDRVWKIFNQ